MTSPESPFDPLLAAYDTAFAGSRQGFCLLEKVPTPAQVPSDFRYLLTNPAFDQQTGLTQTVGKTIRQLLPQVETHILDYYDAVARTGESSQFETYMAALDRWIAIDAFRVGQFEPPCIGVLFTDITESHKLALALRQQEEQQRFLLRLSDALRPMPDAGQIATLSMQAMAQRLDVLRAGYYEVEADQDTFSLTASWERPGAIPLPAKMLFTEFGPEVREGYRAGRTLVVRDTELEMTGEDNKAAHRAIGVRAWIGVPLIKHGRMVVGLGVHSQTPRNWTETQVRLVEEIAERTWVAVERARAEEALAESEKKYRTLFEAIDEGFCIFELVFDEQGNAIDWIYTEANPAFEKQTGYLNPIGQRISHFQPDLERSWFERFAQVARTGEPVRFIQYTAAMGIWYDVYALRVDWAGENRVSLLFTDITERRRAEEALQLADRRKDEFLAMLAHELRNPMSTIRSGLQILSLSAGGDERTTATVSMMNRQTDHLVRMVDDLLDVSRISRGKIDLKPGRVNLVELVQKAVDGLQTLFEQSGKLLSVDLPPAPIYLEGDATRLTQVVVNLLTNGIRYTGEKGAVWLSLTHQAESSDRQEAIIRIRDNGIGLAADQLTAIFELFVQVDNSLARAKGGLGLGLTLVKRLVEMHGGRVEVQSQGIGQGSTFTVHLPTLTTATEFTPSIPQATNLAVTRRILIIDDNADAALMMAMLLKLKGYETHSRNSGRAGIEAAERLQPEAILLDIGMPELDGYATCGLIRQQAWGQRMVIIALTGYGQEEDRQRTKEVGFDGHLVKPVDLDTLTKLLTDLLDK